MRIENDFRRENQLTTIRPDADAASDFVRKIKEQKRIEQSGTVFESESHQRKEIALGSAQARARFTLSHGFS